MDCIFSPVLHVSCVGMVNLHTPDSNGGSLGQEISILVDLKLLGEWSKEGKNLRKFYRLPSISSPYLDKCGFTF